MASDNAKRGVRRGPNGRLRWVNIEVDLLPTHVRGAAALGRKPTQRSTMARLRNVAREAVHDDLAALEEASKAWDAKHAQANRDALIVKRNAAAALVADLDAEINQQDPAPRPELGRRSIERQINTP